jgi:hypothetical protein
MAIKGRLSDHAALKKWAIPACDVGSINTARFAG